MDAWRKVSTRHTSDEERRQILFDSFEEADAAILHFVEEMQKRGCPGARSQRNFFTVSNVRIWNHTARYKISSDRRAYDYKITIDANGKIWAVDGVVRIRNGDRFEFSSTPGLAFLDSGEEALKAFQLLYIELVRKYGISLPPNSVKRRKGFSMRPWHEVQRTHVSHEQKQAKRLKEEHQAYLKATAAIAHFMAEMNRRENPGLERFEEDRSILVWTRETHVRHSGQSYERTWRLVIEKCGRFWLVQEYSPPGGEYPDITPGGWNTRGGRIENFPQHYPREKVVSQINAKRGKTPRGIQGDALLEEDAAQGFQLALIELIRKYSLPLPPD